jgi:hypothetical protein
MTIVTLNFTLAAICLLVAYGVHGVFEAYRNHSRFVRTSSHRETFFLIQHQGGLK